MDAEVDYLPHVTFSLERDEAALRWEIDNQLLSELSRLSELWSR